MRVGSHGRHAGLTGQKHDATRRDVASSRLADRPRRRSGKRHSAASRDAADGCAVDRHRSSDARAGTARRGGSSRSRGTPRPRTPGSPGPIVASAGSSDPRPGLPGRLLQFVTVDVVDVGQVLPPTDRAALLGGLAVEAGGREQVRRRVAHLVGADPAGVDVAQQRPLPQRVVDHLPRRTHAVEGTRSSWARRPTGRPATSRASAAHAGFRSTSTRGSRRVDPASDQAPLASPAVRVATVTARRERRPSAGRAESDAAEP